MIYVVHQKFIDGSVDVNAKGEEVVCAKGDDLTERKRLLVDYSDAISMPWRWAHSMNFGTSSPTSLFL